MMEINPENIFAKILINLYPYQRVWVYYLFFLSSKDVGILGSRQRGKDYILSLVVAISIITSNEEWQIVSATRGHAQDMIRDVRQHLAYLMPILRMPARAASTESKTEIEIRGKGRVKSHAANVRSFVGHRGNFVLNEISQIPNARDVFEAAIPIVNSARELGKPARMVILGNASYVGSYWHQLWTGDQLNSFKKITTTFTSSLLSKGFSESYIKEERHKLINMMGLGAFEQWYECRWRVAEDGFFPQLVLDKARHYEELNAKETQVLGLDVGHGGDPSALVSLVSDGFGTYRADKSITWKETQYEAQLAHVRRAVARRPTAVLIVDETGAKDFAQILKHDLRDICPVVGYHFTAASKWSAFRDLLQSFEARNVLIEATDLDLRMELDSILMRPKAGGIHEIVLPRAHGAHGDRAVALALALVGAARQKQHAATSAGILQPHMINNRRR